MGIILSSEYHRSLHLEQGELEPPNSKCLFCDSENRRHVCTLQEDPEVLLLECHDCYAVSASRMPTEKALSEYYSHYYSSAVGQFPDAQITFDNPLRLAKKIASMYCRFNGGASLSVLDFGGGDGTLSNFVAEQLIKRGVELVNITVIDYNRTTICPRDTRITIGRANSLDEIDKVYELVIASAVIEHLPYPRVLLQKLLQCMGRNSIFYARTPYMSPIIKLLWLFGIKMDFTYPGHLHDLGQPFWEEYFKRNLFGNFHLLSSRPSPVQTAFHKYFLRTLVAYSLKAPWYLLGKSYKYVGGWEIFVQKT